MKEVVIVKEVKKVKEVKIVKEVITMKEVISCDVSPVAMFYYCDGDGGLIIK